MMEMSKEYPDLAWIPPKAWREAGRAAVQLIVIHDTEGSEHASSAEDGARYNQTREDDTSAHYFHDQDSTVQCVLTEDIAFCARAQGNRRGIQHELCGKANQGAAGWADAASEGTLRQAAKQCARDATKWGIPVRRLTPAQVRDGVKGFCGHVDITYAFPEDNGDHTDPGPTFPWDHFLDLVNEEMDMSFDEDKVPVSYPAVSPTNPTWTGYNALGSARDYAHRTYDTVVAQGKAITAALNALNAKDHVDEVKLAKELAPAVAAIVVPAVSLLLADLPAGVEVTSEALESAILGALRQLAPPVA